MSDIHPPVRTRFAPSPTGRMHIGGTRTALYAYLLARQTGGQFLLRLEDSDRKRFVPSAEAEIIQGLKWLGIEWDEGIGVGGPYGPYRQSERREIYQDYARSLIENGHAYYCFCTPQRLDQVRKQQQANKETARYDGACRDLNPEDALRRVRSGEPHVVRFRMPQSGSITMRDHLRGEITVENRQLDDYIIVRSDGLALYHLAAMADDFDMKITHVIRGAEWLATFPLHAHIVRAMGWPEPVWMHLSVFLRPSGKGKMSKRESASLIQDGYSVFLTDLADLGYLPEAVTNWIALMGWSYDDHTEFFTMPDLIEKFSIDRLNPAPAAVNFTKFDHFNGLHIRALSDAELARRMAPFFAKEGYPQDLPLLERIAPLLRERLNGLDEAPSWGGLFFEDTVQHNPDDLVAKGLTAAESAAAARRALVLLEGLPHWSHSAAEEPMRQLAEELGLKPGQFFGILRVAVTGRTVSPPLFESMEIIGRDMVLARLRQAIAVLENA